MNRLRRRIAELEGTQAGLQGEGKGLDRPSRQLRLILQNMPIMLDAFDSQGNIVLWNRECERVTGYSSEEIVGNPRAMEMLYPNASYRQRMIHEWKRRGNDYRHWEWQITCKDGSSRTIQWSNLSGLYPIEGWATWGVGTDVTPLKEALRTLEMRDRAMASAINGMAIADTEGILTYVNRSLLRMWGYEQEEQVIGKHACEFWQSQADGMAVIEALHSTGSWTGDLAAVRPDGSTFYVRVSAATARDENGDPVCMVGSFEDITSRKQTTEELRRFKAVCDEASHGTAMADPQGHFIYVNEAFARMHGFGVSELVGKHVSVVHTAEQMEHVNQLIDRLRREGSFVGEEVWHRRKDDTDFPTLMNGTLIHDREGQPVFLGATCH